MKKDRLEINGMHNGASAVVFKNAAKLRGTLTESEKRLWEFVKTKPLGFKFRRQHPIGGYVLDFYCHKLRLSIEVDGGYHLAKEQRDKDAVRTSYLNELGICELRFTNKEILDEFEVTTAQLIAILHERSPYSRKG